MKIYLSNVQELTTMVIMFAEINMLGLDKRIKEIQWHQSI